MNNGSLEIRRVTSPSYTFLFIALAFCAWPVRAARPAADAPINPTPKPQTQPADGVNLSVKSFGARGDGKADDAPAIQSAINAAKTTHATLYFPSGTYLVKSPLNFTRMNGLRIDGAQSSGSVAQVGGNDTVIVYDGPPLPTECPFDFSDSTWIWVSNISFASSPAAACVVLLDSSHAESEDLHFENVSIGAGTVASVADASAEVIEFSDSSLAYGTGDGLLLSSSGLEGYRIKSPFGFGFSARSMTQVTFRGGKIVSGSGHAVELDGTGNRSTIPVADVSFFGTYIAGSGSGAAALYLKGNVWALTDVAQRFEIDSQTGPAYFIRAAQGARIVSLNVTGLNISPSAPKPCYALYSSGAVANSVIVGGAIAGVSVPVEWNGSLVNLDLVDSNKLNVRVSGDAVHCRFRGAFGIAAFAVSGNLDADIQGWKNVVKFAAIYGPGSAAYTIRQSGQFVATYASDVCSFDADTGPGATNISSVHYVSGQAVFANPGLGRITCPSPGTSAAPVVSAAFTGTGDFFVVRRM